MKLSYKLWARVEIYDNVADCHEDLDPETCEYKIFETDDLLDLARYIMTCQEITGNQEDGVLLELQDALERQGFKP